jgi:hypothetical protein
MTTQHVLDRLRKHDISRLKGLSRDPSRFAVWESDRFTVIGFHTLDGVIHLKISRNQSTGMPEPYDNIISREDLQAIKNECGYADRMAVEIYPAADRDPNFGDARHLWIFAAPLPFSWKN